TRWQFRSVGSNPAVSTTLVAYQPLSRGGGVVKRCCHPAVRRSGTRLANLPESGGSYASWPAEQLCRLSGAYRYTVVAFRRCHLFALYARTRNKTSKMDGGVNGTGIFCVVWPRNSGVNRGQPITCTF